MRERPILFRPELVRAILEGRKTVTRRIVKLHPPYVIVENTPPWTVYATDEGGEYHEVPCPYGSPGDRLWVRETWSSYADGPVVYKADEDGSPADGKWRPSIFMPRHASRLTLEVVSVRVERVQEISEADAKAEGIEATACYQHNHDREYYCTDTRLIRFRAVWDAINGKRAPWASNPWVWRIEFRKVPK